MEEQQSLVDDTHPHNSWESSIIEYDEVNMDVEKPIVDGNGEHCGVCINPELPGDVWERILLFLPIAIIIKFSCVCKRWYELVHSGRFVQNLSTIVSRKPWYFMFTCDEYVGIPWGWGHVYDPELLKWHKFGIPLIGKPSWSLVSSSGLVCFMDNDYQRKLYVCNPITKRCQKLKKPPGATLADYCALSLSLDRSSHSYVVTVVKSKRSPGDPEIDWDLSIDVYSSEKRLWAHPVKATLQAWRSGTDSVICGGVLYFVVYVTQMLGYLRRRYGVVAFDLTYKSINPYIDDHVITAPGDFMCVRLANLEGDLVMVGGICSESRPCRIKGIGIWVLKDSKWKEVSRMPHKLFRGSEFDDVFGCSGSEKVIYIQCYGSPIFVMFDMDSKKWSWSRNCPVINNNPLQLYSGICFEPRLDIFPQVGGVLPSTLAS